MRNLNFALLASVILFAISCQKETSLKIKNSVSNSNSVNANTIIGRQQLITMPTGDYTYPTSQALLWLPDNYNTAINCRYPIIIALEGTGEQGTDINMLLHSGAIAKHIADGWNPIAKNPLTNKQRRFIVFTPQCPVTNGFGWSCPHIKTMLTNLKLAYRIDTSRIYITGYSAGGWGLWSCITDDTSLCKQFAAIVPVSTASADHPDKIPNVDKYGIACWNICGMDDAFYTNAVNYTNIINSNNPPIAALLTGLKGVGHSAWVQAYDTSWRVNNKNLFEWLLQYQRKK